MSMDVLATQDRLAELYRHPGPFVSVYLDATRVTESGAHEVDVRWRDVRDQLTGAGADEADLDAIGAAVAADAGAEGRHGLVIVAADGQVVLAGGLAGPPALGPGNVAAPPHL